MKLQRCVVIGGGHAAGQLAVSLRKEGWQGEIIIVTKESYYPYHRPALSKALLLDEKTEHDIYINKPDLYDKKGIECLLDSEVVEIRRDTRNIILANGDEISYDKLVFATGGTPRNLPIVHAGTRNVYYLYSIADSLRLKGSLARGRNVAIIGGGFIGLEVAAALRKYDLHVTIIEAQSRLLSRVCGSEVSDYFEHLHRSRGVNIVTNSKVTNLDYIDGNVSSVHLDSGETVPVDFLVVGIGMLPNTQLALQAGIEVNNGVVVDHTGCTSDPCIFAIGDCANFPNPLLGYRARLESVQNAMAQAKHVASVMCGNLGLRRWETPWFWSDQYDVKLQIAGVNLQYDNTILAGDPDDNKFILLYFKNSKLIAVDCINSPKLFMIAKKLVVEGADEDHCLERMDFALN